MATIAKMLEIYETHKILPIYDKKSLIQILVYYTNACFYGYHEGGTYMHRDGTSGIGLTVYENSHIYNCSQYLFL